MLENNIPIDTRYYLDNQLSKPLLRIFEPLLGDKAQSLREKVTRFPQVQLTDAHLRAVSGDHTRTIQIATPTVGGLMKFAVKAVTCLGCKTALRPSNGGKGTRFSDLPFHSLASKRDFPDAALCNDCRPRMAELYHKQVASVSELQVRFSRLWTQCQRCQGSLHQVRRYHLDVVIALLTRFIRMFFAVVRIAPFSTCERRRRRTWKMQVW